jgi:adenylate kinase family enzyme
MRERLLILGASGSGTSTLGREIAASQGIALFDADDFFWESTDPPFQRIRERAERERLLTGALSPGKRWVLTGSICGWGDVLIPLLDLAVFVVTPRTLRLERLRERERHRFGERLSPGGDMRHQYRAFLTWAARYDEGPIEMRSRRLHEQWLKQLVCPVVRVDGSRPIEMLHDQIVAALAG